MIIEQLPQGKDAVIFNDINCNVAGLFLFSRVIIDVIDIIENKFSATLPIKEIYGSLPVKWNSGRLLLKKYNIEKDIRKEFSVLKSKNITPAITFSNPLIRKNDLDDVACNSILENLSMNNGIAIISSNLLYDYISTNYPNVKLEASIIKSSIDKHSRTVDYYNNLADSYFKYVVHVDDNKDYRMLKEINKTNAEIIVNERCYSSCPFRKNHYISISEEQIAQSNGIQLDNNFLESCSAIPEKKQIHSKKRNISMTFDEYINIYKLGFRNFKIQGRTNGIHTNLFDILRFTLEPKIAFTQAFPIICEYIDGEL